MKAQSITLIAICLLAYALSSCNNISVATSEKYHTKGRFLIRETYSITGRLITKQSFDKDTIPDGEEIEYYANGKIKKWKWFNKNSRKHHPDSLAALYDKHKIDRWELSVKDGNIFPDCIAYYDTMGKFDTFVGKPFIGTEYDNSYQMYVSLINPPNVDVVVLYSDYVNEKLDTYFFYIPLCTDTICSVKLMDHKPQRGHEYEITYFFEDSLHHPRMSVRIELENNIK